MTSKKISPSLYKRPLYEDALDMYARIQEERDSGHIVQLSRSHAPRPKKRKAYTFMKIMIDKNKTDEAISKNDI